MAEYGFYDDGIQRSSTKSHLKKGETALCPTEITLSVSEVCLEVRRDIVILAWVGYFCKYMAPHIG